MIVFLIILAALIAVNLVRGDVGGALGVVGLGRSGTWLLTMALFGVLLVLAGNALKMRWDGIFIDERNKISLSRVQLVLWTLLLVSALLTVGLSNVSLGAATPLEIEISRQRLGAARDRQFQLRRRAGDPAAEAAGADSKPARRDPGKSRRRRWHQRRERRCRRSGRHQRGS